MSLPIKYILFALIATTANIGAQDLVVNTIDNTFNIFLSVIAGTSIGLVIKYILDKHYIFHFRAHSATHDTQTFALYVAMGFATTALFWSIEFGFHYIFGTKEMRYLGGIIGLSAGYLAKYHLDKRFVFHKGNA